MEADMSAGNIEYKAGTVSKQNHFNSMAKYSTGGVHANGNPRIIYIRVRLGMTIVEADCGE